MKRWERAFVVQFTPAGEAGANRLSGRVEHVATGHTATFQSMDELTQLLESMLARLSSTNEN